MKRESKAVVVSYHYDALSAHEDDNPDIDPMLRDDTYVGQDIWP